MTIVWHHGGETDFDVLAFAWAPKEVEVEWTTPGVTAAATGVRADQVRLR